MLDQVIEETAADAEALGCVEELSHCRTIVGAGTSADAQLKLFDSQIEYNGDRALRAVTSWIAEATLR
jgi:carboxylate-amine ligase